MLAYTVYSEAGGTGKTTLAANLAQAHTDRGRSVLVLDLDPQNGSLSHLVRATEEQKEQTDNIARHLIGRPEGEFTDLICETPFGFDVVPSDDMLEDLSRLLLRAEEMAADMDESFEPKDRLRRVLRAADITETYDTLIIDPPATPGAHLYNSIAATRSIVLPVRPTGKGIESVKGLEQVVQELESELGFEVGVLAVVPNGVGQTTDQGRYRKVIDDLPYRVPVTLRNRASLFEGCWDERCTAFYYVGHHRSSQRQYEIDTLDRLRQLAAHIEETGAGE